MAESFDTIYARACERKGGPGRVDALLPDTLAPGQVADIPDDRILAAFTKKVFQSGFVWRVIEKKWPDFETVFFGFDIDKVLLMPDEMLEQKAADKRIVRNYKKVMTVRDNAIMIKDVAREHGSFAAFAAGFQGGDIVQLWQFLKKRGARLGGNTGPYALRALGIDTFLLSQDVEDYFRKQDLIHGGLQTKRSLDTIARQFDHWQQQSGRPLAQLSMILALSWGVNRREA